MQCIQFRDVPPGEAPWEIRKEWTDLTLPLCSPDPVQGQGWDVRGVLTGQPVLDSGFSVRASDAFNILEFHHPEAAQWWRTNVPALFRPMAELIFSEGVCEVVDAVPSITLPCGDGNETMSVEEFFRQLGELQGGDNSRLAGGIFVSCIKDAFSPEAQEELMHSGLTRPMILLFSSVVSAWVWRKHLDRSVSKEVFSAIHDGGHEFLRNMHGIAAAQSVHTELEKEIDGPLSLSDVVDTLIRAGFVEERADGTIRLTPHGEELTKLDRSGGDDDKDKIPF
ncbi:MAG: hypothetical protein Q8P01_04090 [bacterium]|nr:hypothetical protein [bacterium]